MNRHLARTLAMQTLYEWDFQPEKSVHDMLKTNLESSDHADENTEFITGLIDGVVQYKDDIDGRVEVAAPEWPLDQISVIDKSILRLAIYELLYTQDVPAKVAINEAVELAKTFGGDNTSRFINGVLGTVYRNSERFTKDSATEAVIED
jgi:transcription antitermination protein NusB